MLASDIRFHEWLANIFSYICIHALVRYRVTGQNSNTEILNVKYHKLEVFKRRRDDHFTVCLFLRIPNNTSSRFKVNIFRIEKYIVAAIIYML